MLLNVLSGYTLESALNDEAVDDSNSITGGHKAM